REARRVACPPGPMEDPMYARVTACRRRSLPHSCHRQRAAQAGHLGLQRDDGFLECGTLLSIQEVGIPHVGTRPKVIMLANRKMATPVLGMRRKRDVEVSRYDLLRQQHPMPPEGEASKRALILARIGVGPLREKREGGLHTLKRVLNVMVCQEHTSLPR